MRIAYLCTDRGIPVFGQKGCSLHVQEVVHALRSFDIDVTLFAARVGGNPPPRLASLPLVQLPSLGDATGSARERAAIDADRAVAKTVLEAGPFDVVYERYALWSHATMDAAKAMGATTVLEVNAPLIEEQAKFRGLYDRAAATVATQRAFSAADVIIAVSEEVARYLRSFPQARHKVHVVPNGVDVDRFREVAARRKAKSGAFTVGFVGTLKPWHGVDILLEAFALLNRRVPNAELLIVGDGPERQALNALAGQLGIVDKVTFTGAVSPDAVPDLLARMDVGVAPYPDLPDFYFSPLKVYEYMASGLPVVASRIGQIQEIVSEPVDGLLPEPGNAQELSAALCSLYECPALGRAMGWEGQCKVEAHHTWRSVVIQTMGLIALSRSGPGLRGVAS